MEILHKTKNFFKSISPYTIGSLIFIVTALLSFGLGRLSVENGDGSKIAIRDSSLITDNCPAFAQNITNNSGDGASPDEDDLTSLTSEGLLVGSKNSDKYHYPWCPGAVRIKEENKVWFKSAKEARSAGYEPAKNCKGLE